MNVEFIEPCCASRQLPPLLREHKVVAFQTNGDVTFEHIMKALSHLAGDELTVTLMTPAIDLKMLRVLAWFGRRGWLKRVQTITHENQSEFVRAELTGNVDNILCYHNERVIEQMLVIDGEKNRLVIVGRFLAEAEYGLRCYTVAVGDANLDYMRMFTETMKPLMRHEYPIMHTNDIDADRQDDPVAEEASNQPRSARRKRKINK